MDYPIRFPDQIRQQLRALRKTKGLTQAQLGKLLGVRQVRIAEIERDPLCYKRRATVQAPHRLGRTHRAA
ncbi:MAG: helix-turn-helix transcriptional regulator [Burkholderiales bacterium]|nr:helix-turn-helix transcriptional regulator [Burkholderiales bacterium]